MGLLIIYWDLVLIHSEQVVVMRLAVVVISVQYNCRCLVVETEHSHVERKVCGFRSWQCKVREKKDHEQQRGFF